MKSYNSFNRVDLDEFLHLSNIHDSTMDDFVFNFQTKTISLRMNNTYFQKSTIVFFENIKVFFFKKGNWVGKSNVVLSLMTENDPSSIQRIEKEYNISLKNMLYCIIQTFSGDEIHFLCEQISIDIV